ncbi:MAG: hypothetical protein Q9169_007742, partial [Polycauliona sp. 2 TL-2023]
MATVAISTIDPRNHIEHLAEYQLIICKKCRYAVWPEQVQKHYQGPNHKWKKRAAIELATSVQSWPGVIQYPIELTVPNRVINVIPILPIYDDGVLCQINAIQCQYVCRSKKWMIDHCKQKHDWSKQIRKGNVSRGNTERQKPDPWVTIRCQRFFPSRHGSQYFAVGEPIAERLISRQAQNIVPIWQQAKEAMAQVWKAADEKESRMIAEGEISEVNPWLERAGWHRYLVGLDREKLSCSIARPEENKEPVAEYMWSIVESMAWHCQETATSRVGNFVRLEAIRTEKDQTKYHPLQPYQNPKSFGDYIRAWQQVLMFFMRTKDSKTRQRCHDRWKMPKYRFTKNQRQAWRGLNDAIQADINRSIEGNNSPIEGNEKSIEEDENEESNESTMGESDRTDEPSLSVLEQLCLKFCISLLDHQVARHEYDSPLVCALAVLGINKDRWMGPDRYPPILSAMIKISRMMVVQQAWEQCDHAPSRPNSSATSSSSSMDSGDDSNSSAPSPGILEEMKSMMDRFMVRGSHGPMQWMLDLRTYGLKIHYNTTAKGHVDWVGDQILYKQMQFRMAEFRGMIHGLVEGTRRLLFEELLFQNDSIIHQAPLPRIPWAQVRDNAVDATRRWNFIRDPRNAWGIVDRESWLWSQIGKNKKIAMQFLKLQGRDFQWQRSRVEDYMNRIVNFREKLLVLMHFTGGQPARAPEILSIRHWNSIRGEHRNIFIENGLVVSVTRGHKGYSMKGDVKVIHRYLPREVGELLVYYLLLVLPFQQQLELAVWKKDEVSAFLWPADPQGRQFTSERMRKCMARESEIGMGVRLTIQSYREVSIAMSRRWVRQQDAFRMDEDDEDGDWNEDDDHQIADEQAGHTSHVAGMIYARGIMERSGEVASKRQRFREASESWHEFLGFGSAVDRAQWSGQDGIPNKRKIVPFQVEAEDARMVRWKRLRKVNIQHQLQQMMGKECRFRGIQEPAIQAIMQGKSPVVAVMGTGGGKSLLFMLPALCEPGGTSIVVVPLIALREDLQARCGKIGITCAEWNSQRPPDAASIVLVTPESAVREGFRTFINRLRATQRLDRIVIDECHIVLNNQYNFRKEMQQLGDLIGAESPMVLLTATLPPSREGDLWTRMHFQGEKVHMFRARTSRHNVRYQIIVDPSRKQREQDEFVVQLVQRKAQRWPDGKLIVYCNSVKRSTRLAELLNCSVYHHHATEKKEKLQQFMQGIIPIMVATSSLGLGLDVPNIRAIIHADRPRNLLDYVQESGRAGRDGSFSEAIIVKTKRWPSNENAKEPKAEELLVDRLMGEDDERLQCRRVMLNEYMDGVMDRVQCNSEEIKCDVCRERYGKDDKEDADIDYRSQTLSIDIGAESQMKQSPVKRKDDTNSEEENTETDEEARQEREDVDTKDMKDRDTEDRNEGNTEDKNEENTEDMKEGGKEVESDKNRIHVDSESHDQWGENEDDEIEAAFRYQQQQREHVRRRQQNQVRQEGREIEKLQQQLRRWQDRCPMCFTQQRKDRHSLMQCQHEDSRPSQKVYQATRQRIRYERYSCCFQCGLPQGLCQRYEQRASQGFWELIPGRDCQYSEIALPILIGLMIGSKEGVGHSVIQRMQDDGVDTEKDEETDRWLG